eukprot:gene3684-4619_t
MLKSPHRKTSFRFSATPRASSRRSLACVTRGQQTVDSGSIACEVDSNGIERLSLREDGWSYYKWRGHDCHYISAGEDNDGPLVVLVHGFGAHAYHWRYTIPALAKDGFRVYALCMLGYGWSTKVEERYSMELWGEQVIDFSRDIAGASEDDQAFIAGNSIGALAALYAASTAATQCRGLCLVNSAGNFEPGAAPGPEKQTLAQRMVKEVDSGESGEKTLLDKLQELPGRAVALGILLFTKLRIKVILNQVYEFEDQVDDALVRSIDMAAEDPAAIGTFYQISQAGSRTTSAARDLLTAYEGPLMLLWGEKDPWMTPSKASRILEIKPEAVYTPVLAGHCPHDDAPQQTNMELSKWMSSVSSEVTAS